MRRVYLDYAATSPVRCEVVKAMQPYFSDIFGNPSSMHAFGRDAKVAIETSRAEVAHLIGAEPGQIIFTSGGTEANNFAIKGVACAKQEKGDHIITASIEHHSVLETCRFLQQQGFKVTYLPVDRYGLVDPSEVKRAITKKTILVSVMHANNEIGTIEPIAEIGKITRQEGICFHTDAVQTFGAIPVNVNELNVDLLSASAHKLYGPKGVGMLYVRKGIRISSFLHGGEQEGRKRAGTENVAGIVGFGKAADLALNELNERIEHARKLRDKLIKGIFYHIEDVGLNGHSGLRLPNNVNVAIAFIEGESVLLNLDLAGIAVSTGSACSSNSLEPSHVLLATGLSPEVCHGTLRFSIGCDTTEDDINYVLEELVKTVKRLREMSPLYKEKHKNGRSVQQ